jgi:hypothetical protein
VGIDQKRDSLMMKAETLIPIDIEVNILNQNQSQREQLWSIKSQFEVLKIVARNFILQTEDVANW